MKTTMMKGARRTASAAVAAMLGLALSGCATGPQLVKPLLHLDEEGGVHYDKSYQIAGNWGQSAISRCEATSGSGERDWRQSAIDHFASKET